MFIVSQENMALGKTVFEDQKWKGQEKWTGENAVDVIQIAVHLVVSV